MAVNRTNPVIETASPAESGEDVIDLRRYLRALGAWWKEILLIGLLVGLAAGLGFWLLQLGDEPQYSAAADVAIVRTVSDVNFDERFTTASETLPAAAIGSRRVALLALALSPALAEDVIAALGDTLDESLRRPAALVRYVDAELAVTGVRTADSDLIRITALGPTPEQAAGIATEWARAYVRNVNKVYGQVPDEVFASIEAEQSAAQADYETAQRALESFTAESRQDELARQINDNESTINLLRRGRSSTLSALIDSVVQARGDIADAFTDAQAKNLAEPFSAEQAGKRGMVVAWVEAVYDGQTQLFTEQVQRDQELLATYYDRWLQVSSALDEATALRRQAQGASEEVSGSNALVLSLLKLQGFTQALERRDPPQMEVSAAPDSQITTQAGAETSAASAPGLVQSMQPVQVQVEATPLQLQLDDNNTIPPAALLDDIDALITTLTGRRTELEGQIAALSEQILSGAGYAMGEATAPIQSELAAGIQAEASLLLGNSILTNTTTLDSPAVLKWQEGQLAALYQLDTLRALAEASQSSSPLVTALGQLEETVRELKSQLEAERALHTDLTKQRDIALDAYTTISNKRAELSLSRAASSSEVRFAAPAVPPLEPLEGLSPLVLAAAGAMAGLVLGVIVALIADFLGKRPLLARGT